MGLTVTLTEMFNAHILDVHLPNILIGIGASIEIPLVTTLGRRIQATHSQIANFVLLSALCRTALDIPFGVVVECVGVRNVMMACLVVNALAALLGAQIASFMTLGTYCVLSGVSLGGFFLSRHIFVAGISSKKHRGLLMSFLSGLLRWSHVIGPLLTGVIASKTGDTRNAFYIAAVASFAAFASLVVAAWSPRDQQQCANSCTTSTLESVVPTPIPSDGDERVGVELVASTVAATAATSSTGGPDTQAHLGAAAATHTAASAAHPPELSTIVDPRMCAGEAHYFHPSALWNTIVDYGGVIWRLGLYIVLFTSLRSNRKLMLMFAGMREEMSDAQVSYLLSFSFIFDAALFPLGGLIMDFMGRQFAMAPVAIGLGASFALLPMCRTPAALYGVAAGFGIADAMGCGVVMTLTADRAPKLHGAPFFGIMRTLGDLGHGVGAGGVSFLVRAVGHDRTCLVLAVTGVVTALWGVFGVPRDADPLETPRRTRAATAGGSQRSHKPHLPAATGEERPLLLSDAQAHRGPGPQYGGM